MDGAGGEGDLHVLFFPFMAPGHMIPMLDMAKLFAGRGARATFLTTPANSPFVQPDIDRFNTNSGDHHRHPIALELISFPIGGAGCENAASLPVRTPETLALFFRTVANLREPFSEILLRGCKLGGAVDAVVTDHFLPWTLGAASELGIPRLVFYGTGFFPMCAFDAVIKLKPHLESPASGSFIVPGLPHRIEMLTTQIAEVNPALAEFFAEAYSASAASHGVVVNSFYELEPEYADHYRAILRRRAWHVGPTCLCEASGTHSVRRDLTLSLSPAGWEVAMKELLDGAAAGSVVYVCFGSMARFSAAQLREVASGLEASRHPFVWVVPKMSGGGGEGWPMPEGFEERVRGRGVVVRGWAPQTAILNHEAVGGFVTHCGWNSTVEAASAGVPMVTWPMRAEQFYNERLVVDVLRVGVAVGVDVFAKGEEDGGGVVAAAEVEAAVRRLMDDGDEAEGMRCRAREISAAARAAVGVGGSSYRDLEQLMRELVAARCRPAAAAVPFLYS